MSLHIPSSAWLQRLFPWLIALALATAIVPARADAPHSGETLIVSQDHAWPPFAYLDSQGQPQGLLIDLWREIGIRLDRPVEFLLADWAQSIVQVQDGRAHVHGGLLRSEERERILQFSDVLFPLRTVAFVASGSLALEMADLGEQAIGVTEGSFELEYMQREHPEMRLRLYGNNEAMILAATRGEIHAFVADYPVGMYLLDRYASPADFRVLSLLYSQPLRAAVAQGNQGLLQDIDKALGSLGDEELRRLSQRWLRSETVEVTPAWFWPVAGGSVVLLLLVLLGGLTFSRIRLSAALRREMTQRTRELEERANQFRVLFDNSAVPTMVHDRDSIQVIAANQRVLEAYGADSVEALNQAAFGDMSIWAEPPYSLEDLRKWFARARELGSQRFEWLARSLDGRTIWEDVYLQPMVLDGVSRIVSTSVNITARKLVKLREEHRSQIMTALLNNAPIAAVLDLIVRSVEAEDPTSSCSILLLDESGKHLHHAAASSLPEVYLKALDGTPIGQGVISCGTTAATGQRVIVEDIQSHPHWEGFRDLAQQAGLRACWSEPILSGDGRVLGSFAIYHKEPCSPDSEDLKRLRIAVELAGIALDRKELELTLQRRAELESQLRSISVQLLSMTARNTDEGLSQALGRLGEHTGADRCHVFLLKDGLRTMYSSHEWCAPGMPSRAQGLQDLDCASFSPWLEQLRSQDHVQIQRSSAQPGASLLKGLMDDGGAQSIIALPMFRETDLMGFLCLVDVQQERVWALADLNLMQVAASLIGSALVRKELELELEDLASHDSLTGLYNRRKFESLLAHEIQRAGRYDKCFSLVLFDIDRFKDVNDHFGHTTGDTVLCRLIETVQDQTRGSDTLARWGGEEFVLLLPETDMEGARRVAEAARERVASTRFPGPGHLTISLGISQYRPGDTMTDLIERADEALYRAKRQGRDQTVSG